MKYQMTITRETILYILFGGLTTIVSLVSYGLLTAAGFGVAMANTFSTVLAVAFAFVTNKLYVFKSTSWAVLTVLRELFSFSAGRFATYLLETGLLVLLVDRLSLPNLICKCGTTVLVMVCNYIISKWVVFRATA